MLFFTSTFWKVGRYDTVTDVVPYWNIDYRQVVYISGTLSVDDSVGMRIQSASCKEHGPY